MSLHKLHNSVVHGFNEKTYFIVVTHQIETTKYLQTRREINNDY